MVHYHSDKKTKVMQLNGPDFSLFDAYQYFYKHG